MRSLRFSRSSSITRFCSGVRPSAACGDPVALIDLTHLSTVLFDRSHSRIASALGFPALTSSTICRLNSSVKRLGCFGSAMGSSWLFRPSRNCPGRYSQSKTAKDSPSEYLSVQTDAVTS